MDNTSKDSLEQLNKDILVSIADDCMTAYIFLKNTGTEICYGYEDVKKAYETIERTKAEREQTQNIGKENNFEGR